MRVTVNVGAVLAVEMTASCCANQGLHHVGGLSIEDSVGEDGLT